MKSVINLKEAYKHSVNVVGNKAFNLSLLVKAGLDVPGGFVIPSIYFTNFLKVGYEAVWGQLCQRISDSLAFDGLLVVRSSANYEDKDNASFAGLYKSINNVTQKDLKMAIKEVYISADSIEVKNYLQTKNLESDDLKFSVIVQEQINPKVSGVCFTKNPVSGNDSLVIEYVTGLSNKFLSGEEFSSSLEVSRSGRLISGESEIFKLIKDSVSVFLKIEKLFEKPQDIEWAIDNNNKLWILQSRGIIARSDRPEGLSKGSISLILAEGIGISPGLVTGKPKVLDSGKKTDDLLQEIDKSHIVCVNNLRVDQIPILEKVAGVIMSDASLLSHVSIRTRELGVPCVGGISSFHNIEKKLRVSMDGSSGIIFQGSLGDIEHKSKLVVFPNYYNKDRVRAVNSDKDTFLYSIVGDKAMLFLPRIGDKDLVKKANRKLQKLLGKKNLPHVVHKQGAWEGKNAPSTVLVQYKDYLRITNNPKYQTIVRESEKYYKDLDISSLEKVLDSINKDAHRDYIKGHTLLKNFQNNTSRPNNLMESAKYLDSAKEKAAILVGNILVEMLGQYYIDYHLENNTKYSSVDVVSNNKNLKKDYPKIYKLGKLLNKYRNEEFKVLSYKGESFFDLIDWIYSNGYAEYVEEYQW